MPNKKLTQADRVFFELIAEAIFSNPFSSEYEELSNRLGKAINLPRNKTKKRYHEVIAEVLNQRMVEAGIHHLDDVPTKDRQSLEYAYLFHCYNSHNEAFDKLIQHQLEYGREPVPVPFADTLINQLTSFGIEQQQAEKYFSLFYQLRRGYYFIDQALVGRSPSMKALRHALWNNVFTNDIRIYGNHLWGRMEDFSTLLLGETGTGKGTAAAAIGYAGPIPFDASTGRFKHSFTTTFTATNLSQFPESLIESELFGHRKGAFTGAIDNHKGVFERCSSHGALFLDEIGDVSLPTQIKLLNVLQERRFSPVGSHKSLRFEGRVIAATNCHLDDLRAQGRFREDFYYRLCSDVIEVPPLRVRIDETPDELERLTGLLINRMTEDDNQGLQQKVMEALNRDISKHYEWPGNVRELEQAVRRIILTGSYKPIYHSSKKSNDWVKIMEQGNLSVSTLTSHYCQMLYRKFGSYEEVAKRTGLDRRTAKKYIVNDL